MTSTVQVNRERTTCWRTPWKARHLCGKAWPGCDGPLNHSCIESLDHEGKHVCHCGKILRRNPL